MVAALNGDVDNHASLRAAEGLAIPDEITTDAKVIPALVSRRIAAGDGLEDAFRATVASFEGSVVVSAQVAAAPDRLLLAQRGSGQGLYVGLAEDAFVVASEPYGLVEETSTYLRLDGEATGGQIAVLDAAGAGTIEGISPVRLRRPPRPGRSRRAVRGGDHDPRHRPAGLPPLPPQGDLGVAAVHPQDPPGQGAGTGGAAVGEPGRRHPSPGLRARIGSGDIRRILVIGQGTAAVAAQAVAASVERALGLAGSTPSS